MNSQTVIAIISAVGGAGALQALIQWLKDRRKVESDVTRTDVDTKLAYLNTVIQRLDEEAKRSLAERDRLAGELTAEQERSSTLRKRVRELEDELDEVRRAARETEHKCDALALKLRELVADSREPGDPGARNSRIGDTS